MSWSFLSAITAIMFSIAYGMTAYVNQHNDVNAVAWTTSVHLIGVALIILLLPFYLPYGLTENVMANAVSIVTTPVLLAITAGLGSAMFISEICLFNSIRVAPNPGLPTAISNFYIVILALLSYAFAGLPISHYQMAGMVLALFSLYLISV